ncbi:MAG TPA: hypothetical protein VF669_09330 [Tepidisphaeraceae bacterium]|jgi:hypothetical protein
MTIYDVKCPRCGEHATAEMRPDGIVGTYREAFVKLVARRIVCPRCAYNVTSDSAVPFELWYKVDVGGREVWARNKVHATFLVAYLSGAIPAREVDASSVETLPGWMLESKNRALVVERMGAMLGEVER